MGNSLVSRLWAYMNSGRTGATPPEQSRHRCEMSLADRFAPELDVEKTLNAKLEAENAKLREALKPFADLAHLHNPDAKGDAYGRVADVRFFTRYLAAAKAVLRKTK